MLNASFKTILAAMLLAVAGFSMTACDRDEGPMEEAAESVEEGAEEVADEIDDNT